jgi:hypothetical protein
MSRPGGFLLDKAKHRRRAFLARRGWLVALIAAVPALTALAFSRFGNPLEPWVSRGELNAFWIGVGVVGVPWTVSSLLGLDGARHLREAAEAEQWTAQALRPLCRREWTAFHDIDLGGRNIDHALIGRRGVIALETKWTTDEVVVDESGMRRKWLDGRERRDWRQLRSAQRHARDLADLLEAADVRVRVLPVLVKWGPDVARIEGGFRRVEGVLVAVGAQSSDWRRQLRSQPLAPLDVAKAIEALQARQSGARSSPNRRRSSAGPPNPAAIPPPSPKPQSAEARSLQEPDESRAFDALRRWRLAAARAEGVPPYVILHDRHLVILAHRRPTTLQALGACPGIGKVKLGKYGEAILRVISEGPVNPSQAPLIPSAAAR